MGGGQYDQAICEQQISYREGPFGSYAEADEKEYGTV
jgi:hypothetical protein